VADPATVDDLRPGDHACLTFSDADERLDIVAAFVLDGLKSGHKVLCFTDQVSPEALTGQLADRGLPVAEAVTAGRLEVSSAGDSYLAGGAFAADRVMDTLAAQISRSEREGYAGLRLSADMCWALRPVAGLDGLVDFETQVAQLFADGRATAVCQYDRECFDPVTLSSITAAHSRVVAAVTYFDDALLRVCRQHIPPGIRVAGEIDFRHADVLSNALGEAVRLDDHVHVNLAQLRFMDAAAAGVLVQAAVGMAAGQRMTVICQPLVAKVFHVFGAGAAAQLRIVVRDGK
jgi:anti-anti-sigma factor